MEKITINQTPSPLDQAYQRYKDDLRAKITGAESDQDLVRGIIDNEISREKVGELKKKIITPEDFKSYYYPRELPEGTKLRENYSEREVTRLDARIDALQVLPDGRIVSGDGGGTIYLLTPKDDGSYEEKRIKKNSRGLALQVLSDGRIFSGDGGKVYLLTPKDDGSYEEKTVVEYGSNIHALRVLPSEKVIVVNAGGICMLTPKDDGSYEEKTVERSMGYITDFRVMSDEKVIIKSTSGIYLLTPKDDGSYEEKTVVRGIGSIVDFQILTDGKVITAGTSGIYMWTPKDDGSYEERALVKGRDFVGTISAFQVLPDRSIVSGDDNGKICLWTQDSYGSYKRKEMANLGKGIRYLQVLFDGRIATGVNEERIILLE
jgi:hypothetical protein